MYVVPVLCRLHEIKTNTTYGELPALCQPSRPQIVFHKVTKKKNGCHLEKTSDYSVCFTVGNSLTVT